MTRAQRLIFLGIAAAIAVVAVIVLTSAGSDEEEAATAGSEAAPTATATATPAGDAAETPTETPTPTPKPKPPLVRQGKVTELRFEQGDRIRFRVRADVADHVHVHGYDLMKDVAPGQTIAFSFEATITGIFEIELEDSGELIAELRVDP